MPGVGVEFKRTYRILIVDDDELVLASTRILLESAGYTVDTATSGTSALLNLEQNRGRVALVILDYLLKDETGAEVIALMREKFPKLYVLMHSGNETKDTLRRSWDAGAVGFVSKADSPETLLEQVGNWCAKFEATNLEVTITSGLGENSNKISSIGLTGRSEALAKIADKVHRYAHTKENVLILGETGTGKERIARALHPGVSEKFFAINCAAYSSSSELMEADLFGYVKGAFTGANKDHRGIFESASGGTVFLDEVHTLSFSAQQKLLRAIQERVVRPVGSVREYAVNFRLIAAAKPEIEQFVIEARFLADLYERLNVLRIEVPPLRDRPEDIEPLVAVFCGNYQKETGKRKSFLRRTISYFEKYPWPRNIRELENTIRRLCIDVTSDRIEPEHLEAKFFVPNQLVEFNEINSARRRWEETSRRDIEEALFKTKSQREAARTLGVPESTLRSMMKKFGVSGKSRLTKMPLH